MVEHSPSIVQCIRPLTFGSVPQCHDMLWLSPVWAAPVCNIVWICSWWVHVDGVWLLSQGILVFLFEYLVVSVLECRWHLLYMQAVETHYFDVDLGQIVRKVCDVLFLFKCGAEHWFYCCLFWACHLFLFPLLCFMVVAIWQGHCDNYWVLVGGILSLCDHMFAVIWTCW